MTRQDIIEFRKVAAKLKYPTAWQDREIVLTAMNEVVRLSPTIEALGAETLRATQVVACYAKLIAEMRKLVGNQ